MLPAHEQADARLPLSTEMNDPRLAEGPIRNCCLGCLGVPVGFIACKVPFSLSGEFSASGFKSTACLVSKHIHGPLFRASYPDF
jgi:hypothetical protein